MITLLLVYHVNIKKYKNENKVTDLETIESNSMTVEYSHYDITKKQLIESGYSWKIIRLNTIMDYNVMYNNENVTTDVFQNEKHIVSLC